MKIAVFVFLLAVCGAVMGAQNSAVPSGDVTIGLSESTPEYCLGPYMNPSLPPALLQGPQRGPDDITLRLQLKLRYVNRRSETIFLPLAYNFLWRMTVAGQTDSSILRQGGGGAQGMDVKSLMALSHPEAGPFLSIAGGMDASSTVPQYSVLKFKDTVDVVDFVLIPVLDRSSGLDLRGKTVQIATTRDFRSIAPEVVAKLNEKWKGYGTVWTEVVDSATVTFRIPAEPPTRNCLPGPLPK